MTERKVDARKCWTCGEFEFRQWPHSVGGCPSRSEQAPTIEFVSRQRDDARAALARRHEYRDAAEVQRDLAISAFDSLSEFYAELENSLLDMFERWDGRYVSADDHVAAVAGAMAEVRRRLNDVRLVPVPAVSTVSG